VNVSIITPVLLEGDAVSNDIRGSYRALKQAGHDVRLFAEECHAALLQRRFEDKTGVQQGCLAVA
jgi:hypothetical protein